MVNKNVSCPVCESLHGGSCLEISSDFRFECKMCGNFRVEPALFLDENRRHHDELRLQPSKVGGALLSHKISVASRAATATDELVTVTHDLLMLCRSESQLLPSHAIQAANLIRFIGDEVARLGEALHLLPDDIHAVIGALNPRAAIRLTKELVERRLLTADPLGTAVKTDRATGSPMAMFTHIDLSLDGWQQYEEEKRGHFAGNYGFIAMEFGNPTLEEFVKETVKPAVKEGLGFELVHMRDRSRAGVIDNILRVQIRDAKFVIVDLTHDNNGAYWEAGYAEGLGKPVIYICEVEKFENQKTHFDTNHCTTVPWSLGKEQEFRDELVATVRRSLE